MKRCATCNRTYEDSSLNYCLADGAPLLEIASEPTVVIPRLAERKKGRLLICIGLAVFAIAAIVIVLAVALLYKFSGDDYTRGSNNQTNRQVALVSPKPKATPTPTPTETAEGTNKDQSVDVETEGTDEATPILWDTSAGGLKGTPGSTYTFQCPPDGTAAAIFGSDIYTDYSSICTAAVHSGAITLKEGGLVKMEYRPGRTIYGSTVRNEITSITTGEHSRSFIIRPNAKE